MIVRRLGRLGLALVTVLAVTGCVDVVQYISGSGGDIDVYLRLTLQKSAFEMGNAFSDEPQDIDSMFEEEFDFEEDNVLNELPPGVSAEFAQVNDEFEYGFELSYSASRAALNAVESDEAAFVPRIGSRGITIPLGESGGAGGGSEDDQFAAAFLGGAKYRVFVSKMLVSRVSEAFLVRSAERVPVSVLEFPDVWMVQFPVSLWLMSDEPPVLEIEF